MGGVAGETNGSLIVNRAVNGQPSKEVMSGDIVWVKLHEASWWPAQVVDENSVSAGNKPSSKGSSSDVLVRLYGSYEYKYVDVDTSRAEFKKVLEENNCNHDDIMMKSLEKDLSSLNANTSRKRQRSKSKEASQNRSSKKETSNKPQSTKVSSKKQKQEKPKTAKDLPSTPQRVQNGTSTPNTATLGSKELSGRRMKVMQNLGLVAPLGSPFPRSRVISPAPPRPNQPC